MSDNRSFFLKHHRSQSIFAFLARNRMTGAIIGVFALSSAFAQQQPLTQDPALSQGSVMTPMGQVSPLAPATVNQQPLLLPLNQLSPLSQDSQDSGLSQTQNPYVAQPAFSRVQRVPFGSTAEGQAIDQYILRNKNGVTAKIINYGAILTNLYVPDRIGNMSDVVLGFKTLEEYQQLNKNIHFGALIGRYANRIAQGMFTINNATYHLPINDPPNSLHSGPDGFYAKVWKAQPVTLENAAGVELTYLSPDGEEGFPGNLTAKVLYALDDNNALHILYRAATDKATPVNLTSHAYFNLAGESAGEINGHNLMIAADAYTPTDDTQIPTGEIVSVANTPLDFRQPMEIGLRLRSEFKQMVIAHGYDQNWVLNNGGGSTPGFAARVAEPMSGRVLDLWTTQPGLQFYTANGLKGAVVGKSGKTYRQTDGFALEAEHFPNSPNQPNFPSTLLQPGQIYTQETVLVFSTLY